MNKEIHKEIQVSKEDYAQMVYMGYKWKRLLIFPGIAIAVVIFTGSFNGISDLLTTFLPMLIVIGIIVALIKYTIYTGYTNDPFIKRPQNLTITAERITIKESENSCSPMWNELYTYKENKKVFLFYLSPQKTLIIPKRFLEPEEINFVQQNCISQLNLNKEKKTKRKTKFFFFGIYGSVFIIAIISTLWTTNTKNEIEEADHLRLNGNYKAAYALYNKLIEQNKDLVKAYTGRAACAIYFHEYEDAEYDCGEALAINPHYGHAYYELAKSQHFLGNDSSACVSLNNAKKNGIVIPRNMFQQICE